VGETERIISGLAKEEANDILRETRGDVLRAAQVFKFRHPAWGLEEILKVLKEVSR